MLSWDCKNNMKYGKTRIQFEFTKTLGEAEAIKTINPREPHSALFPLMMAFVSISCLLLQATTRRWLKAINQTLASYGFPFCPIWLVRLPYFWHFCSFACFDEIALSMTIFIISPIACRLKVVLFTKKISTVAMHLASKS